MWHKENPNPNYLRVPISLQTIKKKEQSQWNSDKYICIALQAWKLHDSMLFMEGL